MVPLGTPIEVNDQSFDTEISTANDCGPVCEGSPPSQQFGGLWTGSPPSTGRSKLRSADMYRTRPQHAQIPICAPTKAPTSQQARGLWTGSPPRKTRSGRRGSPSTNTQLQSRDIPVKAHKSANAKSRSPGKPLPAPTPTPAYLSQASLAPNLLPTPQRLLLILDLNGTLLYRSKSSSGYRPRPSLQPFLDYCVTNHSVLIWSSATPHNVTAICSNLFTARQRQQLLGEWGRDTLDLTKEQYRDKVQVYKRLDRIWEGRALRDAHPNHASGERWSQANTLLLDDSATKAQGQPHNLVEMPEYTKSGQTDKGKEVLGQVVGYLEEARQYRDVSAFVKMRPFKVDAGWKWDWDQGRRQQESKSGVDAAEAIGIEAGVEGLNLSIREKGK